MSRIGSNVFFRRGGSKVVEIYLRGREGSCDPQGYFWVNREVLGVFSVETIYHFFYSKYPLAGRQYYATS